jgi:hypothetical protein
VSAASVSFQALVLDAIRMIKRCIVLVRYGLGCAVAVAGVLVPSGAAAAASALPAQVNDSFMSAAGESPVSATLTPAGRWQVTIRGTVSGWSFTRSATVTSYRTITQIGTTNGINPVDLCLKSGFPAGLPSRGAIWFGSNSGCFPYRRSYLDMAYVSASGTRAVVQPDSRLLATYVNTWTSSNSLAACPFSPASGTVVYQLGAGGTITGTISLRGYGGAFCGWSNYQATLSGSWSG